jgi:predicted nucleic acid-binding protein
MDLFGKPPKSSIFDERTRNELLEAEKIAHKRTQADADVLEARFGRPNSRSAELKLDGLFGVAPDNGKTPEEVLTPNPALASGQQITELDPNPNNAALGFGQTPDVQTVTQDAPQNALGFADVRPTKNTDAGLSNDVGVLGNTGELNVDTGLTGFTNDGATTGATGPSPHLLAQQAVDQPATIAPAATGVIAAPAAGAGVAIPTAAEIAAGAAKAARVASPIAIGATIALPPTALGGDIVEAPIGSHSSIRFRRLGSESQGQVEQFDHIRSQWVVVGDATLGIDDTGAFVNLQGFGRLGLAEGEIPGQIPPLIPPVIPPINEGYPIHESEPLILTTPIADPAPQLEGFPADGPKAPTEFVFMAIEPNKLDWVLASTPAMDARAQKIIKEEGLIVAVDREDAPLGELTFGDGLNAIRLQGAKNLVFNDGEISLDANSFIHSVGKGDSAKMDEALKGRKPVISPATNAELLDLEHSVAERQKLINDFLEARDGRIGEAPTARQVELYKELAASVGWQPSDDDALIIVSALNENQVLLTNDG